MTSPPNTRNRQRGDGPEPLTGKEEKNTSDDAHDRRRGRSAANIPISIRMSSSSENNPILDTSTSTEEEFDLKSCDEEDRSVCIVRPKSSSDDATTKAPLSFKHLSRSQLAERLQAEISAHAVTKENLNTLKSEHKDLKRQLMQKDKAISKSKQEFLKEFDIKTKLQIRIKILDELANEKKREFEKRVRAEVEWQNYKNQTDNALLKKDIEHKDEQINLLKERLKQANNTLKTAQSVATAVQKKGIREEERLNKRNRTSIDMKHANEYRKEMTKKIRRHKNGSYDSDYESDSSSSVEYIKVAKKKRKTKAKKKKYDRRKSRSKRTRDSSSEDSFSEDESCSEASYSEESTRSKSSRRKSSHKKSSRKKSTSHKSSSNGKSSNEYVSNDRDVSNGRDVSNDNLPSETACAPSDSILLQVD